MNSIKLEGLNDKNENWIIEIEKSTFEEIKSIKCFNKDSNIGYKFEVQLVESIECEEL